MSAASIPPSSGFPAPSGGRSGGEGLSGVTPARVQEQPDGDYSMDHSSVIYLMDKNGAFVEAFNVARPPAEAAKELEKYL